MITSERTSLANRDADGTGRESVPGRPDVLVIVGRPTFDLASAQPLVGAAIAAVDVSTVVVGNGDILQSPEEVEAAMVSVPTAARHLVVLFASFADSRLAASAVDHFDSTEEIVLWSLPEAWTGGRLRRNSFCGANLAAHRLVAEGHIVAGLHETPGPGTERSIERAITHTRSGEQRHRQPNIDPQSPADELLVGDAVESVRSTRLGIVGAPPDGFEPCEVDDSIAVTGATVGQTTVEALFEVSGRPLSLTDEHTVTELRDLAGNDELPRDAVEHAVALHSGAERLAERQGWNALAVRCWPECFDRWHGAACAAMALLNEHGLPAACEADAYGALSMRLMQSLSDQPAFLADIVEVDTAADRIALWHCGVAPRTMATQSGEIAVALHPNRQQPLVFDFALDEGPVTMLRISKAGGTTALAVGEGRLTGEQPFEGTSGVVQLTSSAQSFINTVIHEGLEHHLVIGVGHHQRSLEAVAAELEIPVLPLS